MRNSQNLPEDPVMSALRLPPHSIEAEQSLLGGLLIDNTVWERVGDIVNEADFYRDDHRRIFRQIARLIELGIPFRARVPLIPSVTDTPENLDAAARLLEGAKALDRVELMSYNRAAGAKYAQLGLAYEPGCPEAQTPNAYTQPFVERGMEVVTL